MKSTDYIKRKEENLNRLLAHGQLVMKEKLYTFRSKTIHQGKHLLRFYRLGTCKAYWYLSNVNGHLDVSHGHTREELKEYSNIYFNQFKRN